MTPLMAVARNSMRVTIGLFLAMALALGVALSTRPPTANAQAFPTLRSEACFYSGSVKHCDGTYTVHNSFTYNFTHKWSRPQVCPAYGSKWDLDILYHNFDNGDGWLVVGWTVSRE